MVPEMAKLDWISFCFAFRICHSCMVRLLYRLCTREIRVAMQTDVSVCYAQCSCLHTGELQRILFDIYVFGRIHMTRTSETQLKLKRTNAKMVNSIASLDRMIYLHALHNLLLHKFQRNDWRLQTLYFEWTSRMNPYLRGPSMDFPQEEWIGEWI